MKTIQELDTFMCNPSERLLDDIKKIEGDIMILGAGGKMGPTLCKLAQNAVAKAGLNKKIYAVSRFSNPKHAQDLEKHGIEVIKADLMNDDELNNLPQIPNIIYMVGRKFGTTGGEDLTWAMNAYLPGRVAEKFKDSNIIVFSTGNVYPFVPVKSGGATEETTPGPVGIYAQSCLGRESVFRYFSNKYKTNILIYRLNYAIDLRYGVLLEIAKSVKQNKPVDVTMGYVNVIWQGDANEIAIRSLLHCNSPAEVLNVTGEETLSTRWVANEFAKRFNTNVVIEGQEAENALLSNAKKSVELFGKASVSVTKMLDMIADWLINSGETIDKPTHFQEREGKF